MELEISEKYFLGRRLINEGPVGVLKLIADWKPEVDLTPLRASFAKRVTDRNCNGALMTDTVDFLEAL